MNINEAGQRQRHTGRATGGHRGLATRQERRSAYRQVMASFLPHVWSEFRSWIIAAAVVFAIAVWLVI